jgi:hypothetical protein
LFRIALAITPNSSRGKSLSIKCHVLLPQCQITQLCRYLNVFKGVFNPFDRKERKLLNANFRSDKMDRADDSFGRNGHICLVQR